MLSTLDTVIAFAVIMTVLSLLITIIVQMVSAAFSLRRKNLANALALSFQTTDPNIGGHAHSLAAQILRDPIFTEYDELQTEGAEAFLQSRQKTVNTLKDDIEKTGLTLVPAGFIARWDDRQRPSGFCSRLRQFWPHLFGVLVTAGLLTLGAPLRFNLLKNLMNLRPAVANLIEKRPISAPALPATPTSSS